MTGCEAATCGRYVLDRIVTKEEAEQLIAIAEKGMSLGGGAGGVSWAWGGVAHFFVLCESISPHLRVKSLLFGTSF